jgi:hypothetical protein
LISGIPPSESKESEIEKLVEGMLKRKALFGKTLKYIAGRRTMWMPYYRIRMQYWRSEERSKGKICEGVPTETALNAMFCGCVNGESELLMIFRPNYLRYETVPVTPAGDEVVGPASKIDFGAVLSGLVKKQDEVQNELSKLRSTLTKKYVRKRRYQMLLPMGNLSEEKELSAKIAKLDALRNTIKICLNIDDEVSAIDVLSDDTFYYPTSVFLLKNGESENLRFLVVNLVKTGGMLQRPNCDILLTKLCNYNEECIELVAAALAGSPFPG